MPGFIDLIPSLGYVKGNIDIISYRANMIKNCGTIEEHMKIVQYMNKRSKENN